MRITISTLGEALGVLVLSVAAGDAQTVSFVAQKFAQAPGAQARAIVAADFNDDGWPDLAIGNVGAEHTVGLALNDRTGRVHFHSKISVSAGPFSMAVGDVDRTGTVDLAVVNADADEVTVLSNDTEASPLGGRWLIGTPEDPRGITIADLNRDGKLDVLVTAPRCGCIQVYTRGIGGHFVFGGRLPYGIVSGDFDRDGIPDLAVADSGANAAWILYGDGTDGRGPQHGFPRQETVPVGRYPRALATADFNRDGWLDLAVANTGETSVTILLGGETGFIMAGHQPVGGAPRAVEAADLNGDGKVDVAVANRNGVSVLVGHGDGQFGSAQHFKAGAGARALAVADFNADGRLDIATGNQLESNYTILYNTTRFAGR